MSASYDITIEQGTDFSRTLFLTTDTATPINVAGRTFTAQIRQMPGGTVATAFTCTVTSAAGGQVTMALSAAASLVVPTSGAKYDLLMNNSGTYTRLLAGVVTLSPRITVS